MPILFMKTISISITFSILLFGNIFGELNNLKITEIHYHPLDEGSINGNEFEFIEIKNIGSKALDLTNVAFTDGIDYTFAPGTIIKAGAFIVLALNSTSFASRYSVTPFAVYKGKLNNAGENVTLKDILQDRVVFSVEYNDVTPWPVSPDGVGYSLVPVNANSTDDPNHSTYWRASSNIHGSPGEDDIDPNISPVYVNEVLTHTDSPIKDAIELYNPNSETVNISGWYLTDNKSKPMKFKIPVNTTIAPGDYLTYDEDDFNKNPGTGSSFCLSSHGEEVYIFSATASDSLTGYSHGYSFGEIENGISFGRYITSTGENHFIAQKEITLGKENAGPKVGPLVISEIMYHPINGHEFLEITNISDEVVRLYDPLNTQNTWRIKGIGFLFPQNITIGIGGVILVVSDTISFADFRKLYNVPTEIQIFNDTGTLSNSGETITLVKPQDPYIPDSSSMEVIVPYMDIDKIQYNDKTPWPEEADGDGPSINRIYLKVYSNDPVNWKAESGTPGVVSIQNYFIKGKSGSRPTLAVLNTFKPKSSFTVQFRILVTDKVELNIFDMHGRLLKKLYKGMKNRGVYHMNFDKSIFATGVNILQLKTFSSSFLIYKKVIIVK